MEEKSRKKERIVSPEEKKSGELSTLEKLEEDEDSEYSSSEEDEDSEYSSSEEDEDSDYDLLKEEEGSEPSSSLSDDFVEVNLRKDSLVKLLKEIVELSGRFSKLANNLYILQQSGVYDINAHPFKPKEIQEFLDWRTDFEAAIKEAQKLGAVEEGFLEKYKTYTAKEWDEDPFWQKIKPYYKTITINSQNISELERTISNIQSDQKQRYEKYADVGKHPAAIGFTLGVLPLLILLLYGVDRAINELRLIFNEYQKSTFKEEVGKADAALAKIATAQDELKESGHVKFGIQVQAAIGAMSFFKPIKDAAKEAEEKTAHQPQTPRSSFSSGSDSD